ncbi:hypothetical protein THIOKS12810009 [Thiocapsa sp. KS1]|nr:hypothetical protein THIOKS12810009 [Thiocapsa sp. KS1]
MASVDVFQPITPAVLDD